LGHGLLNRVYLVFKDEDEQDKVVKEHLGDAYSYVPLSLRRRKRLTQNRTSNILAEQHDHIAQEIQTVRDVSKRLKGSVRMVQEAANLAKERRADMIAKRQRRVDQLESLRALVRKKEEEVSRKCMTATYDALTIFYSQLRILQQEKQAD
jgi:hypothetical protein